MQTKPLPVKGITPNTLKIWSNNAPTNGIIVGRDLENLGAASVGSTLISEPSGFQTAVTGRTAASVQSDQFTSNLLILSNPDQPTLDCWVRMEPGAIAHAEKLLQHVFASTPAVTYTPYLPKATGIATPSEQWHAYADSHPWIFASGLATLIIVLSAWTRRSEIAIYRAFGTPKSVITLTLGIDTFLILVPATAVAMIITLIASTAISGDALGADTISVILRSLGSASLLTIAVAIPLSSLFTKGQISDQLKDR